MSRTTLRSLALMVSFLVAMAAMPLALAGNGHERPLKENLEGQTTSMVMPPEGEDVSYFDGRCSMPSLWVTSMEGGGTISHLGKVSWVASHCFYPIGTFGDGELVVTAANGDQLFGTYSGAMTGETTWIDTMVVSGGTGRFESATGEVTETGRVDMLSGQVWMVGEGWIAYTPGS